MSLNQKFRLNKHFFTHYQLINRWSSVKSSLIVFLFRLMWCAKWFHCFWSFWYSLYVSFGVLITVQFFFNLAWNTFLNFLSSEFLFLFCVWLQKKTSKCWTKYVLTTDAGKNHKQDILSIFLTLESFVVFLFRCCCLTYVFRLFAFHVHSKDIACVK